MTPTELGKLFLELYPVNDEGISEIALIDDLVKVCPDFRTKNGCSWARSDNSFLGKNFYIERIKKVDELILFSLLVIKKRKIILFLIQ